MKLLYFNAILLAAFAFTPLSAQVVGEHIIDDFDANRHISWGQTAGTLTAPTDNVNRGLGNTSANVASYARNSAIQYDYVVGAFDGNVTDIADYLSNSKKFSMKLYTSAPVGTPVQIIIGNAAAASAPYPAGRHSLYTTRTTVTNAWETLVFSFDSRPDGAIAGTALNQIVLAFNNGNTTGETYIFDDIKGANIATVSASTRDYLWSNFRNVNRLTYNASDGIPTKIANPTRVGNALSDSVLQYERSTAAQYDVLRYAFNSALPALTEYQAGTKKFSLKVYSPAPGVTVQFTLQDSVGARGGYPAGRAFEFRGTTTATNAWETVVLNYLSAPSPVPLARINELAILFNSGIQTPLTVSIDSIWGPTLSTSTTVINREYLWTNFRNNNHLTYNHGDGVTSQVPNPTRVGNALSDSVRQYVRSAVQYDVLAYSWGSVLPNIDGYVSGDKNFSIKVFSPAAGTTIQFTLQDSIGARGGYPAGRAHEFVGRTITQNQWEWVDLARTGSPDAATTTPMINQVAILFNSNVSAAATILMDSIFGPILGPTSVKPAQNIANLVCYPNPTTDALNISLDQTSDSNIEITLVDINGKQVSTTSIAHSGTGTKNITIPTSQLASGLYICKVSNATGSLVRKISIKH